MNNLLQHPQFGQIRTCKRGDEFYFCGRDLCDVLELEHITNALQSLDEDEKLTVKILQSGQKRKMLFVTESGLYALILKSRKPEARRFRKWITAEVLPALRKYGVYSTDPKIIDKAIKRIEQKAIDEMLGEISRNLSYTDRRMVAKQCRTTESEVNRVLSGYTEDPFLLSVLYSRASGNKIMHANFYTLDGATKLLNALNNAK